MYFLGILTLKRLLLFIIISLPWLISAQTPSQVIRGKVVDAETKTGLEEPM